MLSSPWPTWGWQSMRNQHRFMFQPLPSWRIPQSHGLPLKQTSRSVVKIRCKVASHPSPTLHPWTSLLWLLWQIPEAECLQQQSFVFSLFWRFALQDQGVCRFASPQTSLRGLQKAAFSLCPRACPSTFTVPVATLPLPVTPVRLDQGPSILLGFTLITSLMALSLNIVTAWGPEVWNCNTRPLRAHD